jgi:hypothetical protein
MAVEKNPRPVGRPPKFSSPEELEKLINDYWAYCEEKDKPLSMSGLAWFLGIDRHNLVNYQYKGNEEFYTTIKEAKQKIQNYAEECLYDTNRKNNAGVIFSLKNNYSWIDQQDINAKINGSMTYAIKLPEELEENEEE